MCFSNSKISPLYAETEVLILMKTLLSFLIRYKMRGLGNNSLFMRNSENENIQEK